jgi:putative metal-binding protein
MKIALQRCALVLGLAGAALTSCSSGPTPQSSSGGAGPTASSSSGVQSSAGGSGNAGTGGSDATGTSSSTGSGACAAAADCDDGNPCTADACAVGVCTHLVDKEGSSGCPTGQYCDLALGCLPQPLCQVDADCLHAFGDDPCKSDNFCDPLKHRCDFLVPDADHDGHLRLTCGGDDCDDLMPGVHPGATEVCDHLDNDCDGAVDVGPLIDWSSPVTCGTCENDCTQGLVNVDPATVSCTPSAQPGQIPGVCSGVCIDDFHDLDGNGSCEYYCIKTTNDDAACDLKDDDCDGQIDEDVDVCTSVTDCGKCGGTCLVTHGSPACVHTGPAACDSSNTQCKIQKCDCNGPGDCWWDLDGSYATGCEYACSLTNGGIEKCSDGVDNDCDGQIDEGCP